MKKTLGLALYAGLMFCVTAGLGYYMLRKSAPPEIAESDHHHVAPPENYLNADWSDSGSDGVSPESGDLSSGDPAGSGGYRSAELPENAGRSSGSRKDEALPVAVRSSPMSVEEIVRMGLSLKSRDEVVRKREASLREMEAQQRLVLSDLSSAQHDIENLLAQTADQRAAKEELLARITANNETLLREQQVIAQQKEDLAREREKLEQDRRQYDAEKTAIAQTQSDLAIRRKELDAERKQFEDERTRITLDGEKLVRERETWLTEKEKISSEKKQVALDREQLKVDRELFEQEKRALASTSPSPAASPAAGTPPDDATRLRNLKSVAQLLEGMNPENAAANVRVMAEQGNADMVVDVLMLLEPRKSAAIMDVLQDETLATDFLLRMSNRNAAGKAARKP